MNNKIQGTPPQKERNLTTPGGTPIDKLNTHKVENGDIIIGNQVDYRVQSDGQKSRYPGFTPVSLLRDSTFPDNECGQPTAHIKLDGQIGTVGGETVLLSRPEEVRALEAQKKKWKEELEVDLSPI